MVTAYAAGPGIDVITSNAIIPGYGLVPVNAFVIKGSEPILVDTGTVVERQDFMSVLRSVIDPADLKWIWLTHPDFDHIGSLHQLLDENPRLRVITTFLGVGILGLSAPLPLDRVYLVNPGESITVGDRTLTAIRPPSFDNPSTTGFYDSRAEAFFSSDCFGALLPSVPQRAADLSEKDLRDGQIFWATVDSPWLHKVDSAAFAAELEAVRRMQPKLVLSSHLPPAGGDMMDRLIGSLAAVRTAQAFVGPNQAALEQMLQKMANV